MDQDGLLHKRFGKNHIPRYYSGDGSTRSMRWIRMDQRTEDCVGMASSAPGKGFEDGSRRSIGWIDVDCYRGYLAQLTLPATTWAMDQDGSAHRRLRRHAIFCTRGKFWAHTSLAEIGALGSEDNCGPHCTVGVAIRLRSHYQLNNTWRHLTRHPPT